jgi:hypothetical protein
MLCRVALVRTDVSEELSASIIRVTRIGELGTCGVTSKETPFFIVTATETSNLTERQEPSDLCVSSTTAVFNLGRHLRTLTDCMAIKVSKRTIPTERPLLVGEF